jgi:hypothetical protein
MNIRKSCFLGTYFLPEKKVNKCTDDVDDKSYKNGKEWRAIRDLRWYTEYLTAV